MFCKILPFLVFEIQLNLTFAESFRWCIAGSCILFPEAAFVDCIKSDNAEATSLTALINITWASRFGDPRLAAPDLTTSLNWTIVVTAFWAATASCSCEDAAPATRVFVSSTKAFAVFRIFSRWSKQNQRNWKIGWWCMTLLTDESI